MEDMVERFVVVLGEEDRVRERERETNRGKYCTLCFFLPVGDFYGESGAIRNPEKARHVCMILRPWYCLHVFNTEQELVAMRARQKEIWFRPINGEMEMARQNKKAALTNLYLNCF
jgi:hypothetical protein